MKQKHFMKCCYRYWYYFVAGLILAYILAAVVVEGNTIIGEAIDIMLAGEKVAFKTFTGKLLMLIVIGFVVAFLKSWFAAKFSIKVQAKYKNMVAHKLYRLEYCYFDQNGSASVINKVNSDVAEIETLLNQNVPEICTNLVAMVTYAIYVGQINMGLLVLILVSYPFLFFFTNTVVKKIENLRKVFRQKSDFITEISQDCINGIMVLRAFGAEEHFQNKLNMAADDLVANEGKRVRITNNALIIRKLLQWLPNIISAVYAYVMVLQGNISLGELVVFLMILQKFVDAFVGVPFHLVDAKESMVCVKRVEEILTQAEEASGDEKEGIETEVAISFEGVGFSYVEEKEVLSDLTFQVKQGTSVAFVGDSGGGKSTIFHLLCGFYRIHNGCYKLFGRDFGEWDIRAAREQMALVSQNVFLFPTSIRENVRYGNLQATDDEVEHAAKLAHAHEFILNLEKGYDTKVGERGNGLSGGQRQRIAIARAILKEAPIILLDEATSALDNESEQLVNEALKQMKQEKTIIMIAHRPSTIELADRKCVVGAN